MNAPDAYNCVIIDDDEIDRLTTQMYARKYPFLNITGVFSSAEEAALKLGKESVDVLLTDIDMPGLNGLDFRATMMQVPVCVFITSFPDYAAEGFEVEAFDFLVKPIKSERFEHCMHRVRNYFELKRKAELFEYSLGSGNTIFIKDGHQQIKLNLHEIVYLEALKDYTRIVTTTKKYSVLSSIGNLLLESAFQSFLRIHRSYAVQRHFIDRVTPQQVYVRDYSLPVGRTFKDALLNLK
ncbi:LytR/AlgR family response regulator transcription factor [Dyadobacter arcticus]|uniref:DNA-binding LytR/AlgR family response regulator n=1 Tax=Dyadobacter arcticus TaxID=1078754 RepID=A0ABX0ULM4_9BACT|nr:LytTR family DNA-binding domain-containing protein [Dyadobacter arcticus]NIJ53899.1 DNA-binding LytR/AlgR family response regulator [Dyadobacter arcticus]